MRRTRTITPGAAVIGVAVLAALTFEMNWIDAIAPAAVVIGVTALAALALMAWKSRNDNREE